MKPFTDLVLVQAGLLFWVLAGFCALPSPTTFAAEAAPALYANDFEGATLDSVPEGFQVLDGAFAVKEEGGNKFLELPGAPLSTYGLVFGPKAKDGLALSARIWTTKQGRRFSTFGVGLNGAGGFRLQVSPAKKRLELYKGETLAAAVPYEWESGVWTHFTLQVRPVQEGRWKVEGKVWKDGQAEPGPWMIEQEHTTEPYAGQPSVWGNPFAGTPIRFDDLRVDQAAPRAN